MNAINPSISMPGRAQRNGPVSYLPVPVKPRRPQVEVAPAWVVFAFILAHVPLAFILRQTPLAGTLHALATAAVGLMFALSKGRSERTAYVVAYITGAEVLWRMTGAGIPWEFGKYAVAAILILDIARSGRFNGAPFAFIYLALMLPSMVVTISERPADAREIISFNLSGPISLAVCTWFFSRLRLSQREVCRIFLSAIGPLAGVTFLCFFGVVSTENIKFNLQSNFETSGGFAPNQVSAVLGLCSLLAFLYLMIVRKNWATRLLMLGLLVVSAAQSTLTFSRGGIYMAGGAILLALFYFARDNRARINALLVAGIFAVLAQFVIFPAMNNFTGGKLEKRFTDTDPTGRDSIIQGDLQLWAEHPVFGAGPGMSKFERAVERKATAHTEFTRLLSEHGLLGLAAILMLFGVTFKNVRRSGSSENKAVVAALVCWSFLFMVDVAMRLVAPSLFFGMSFIQIQDSADTQPRARKRGRKIPRGAQAYVARL